jgi:hypothetical protein
MKLAIFLLLFLVSEIRIQAESLILNVIKNCLPNEKIVNLNFVSEIKKSDESLQHMLENFLENKNIFVSSER